MKLKITMKKVPGGKKYSKVIGIKAEVLMELLKEEILEEIKEVQAKDAYIIKIEDIDNP